MYFDWNSSRGVINMFKSKMPIWVGYCLMSGIAIACGACYAAYNSFIAPAKTTEYCMLSSSDINNLDASIDSLFKGKSKTITVGIIGNGNSDKTEYDSEIKKYCDKFGVKTHFMHTDIIDAVTLKR